MKTTKQAQFALLSDKLTTVIKDEMIRSDVDQDIPGDEEHRAGAEEIRQLELERNEAKGGSKAIANFSSHSGNKVL
jgi:hypothetical protein